MGMKKNISSKPKLKKRVYNEMLNESQKLHPLSSDKDNKDLLSKNIHKPIPKINNSPENISLIKTEADIRLPTDYTFDKTHMPSLELVKGEEENRKLNIPIYIKFITIFKMNSYDNILKNIQVKEDSLLIQNIYGDGNCLFRCINYFLTGTEAYHTFIRHLLYNYIISNQEEILADYPYVYYKGTSVNTDEYIHLIKENGNYGGELECNLITKIIPINILVLTYHQLNDGTYCFKYYNYYGKPNNENYLPLCIMEYKESNMHYQLLYYNKNYKNEIILNDKEQIIENINNKEKISTSSEIKNIKPVESKNNVKIKSEFIMENNELNYTATLDNNINTKNKEVEIKKENLTGISGLFSICKQIYLCIGPQKIFRKKSK